MVTFGTFTKMLILRSAATLQMLWARLRVQPLSSKSFITCSTAFVTARVNAQLWLSTGVSKQPFPDERRYSRAERQSITWSVA